MSHVSSKLGQFAYFDAQLGRPAWRGKYVLDFGGNAGNILRDPACAIEEDHYWCIDVSADAIARGRRDFPRAHWLAYGRYNFCFNPTGTPGLAVPDTGRRFDYILAYSVFTHILPSEMLELVEHLLSLLDDHGVLAFSFIDPFFHSWPGEYRGNNFAWRLDRINSSRHIIDVDRASRAVAGAPWFVLVGDTQLYVATERFHLPHLRCRTFHVYHTQAYLAKLYPNAHILPPANGEMQHCCLLTRNSATG